MNKLSVVLFVLGTYTTVCSAFSLNWSAPVLVGIAESGSHFWQPRRGVFVSENVWAFQARLGAENCTQGEPCPFAIVSTADAGASYQVFKGEDATLYCGDYGVVRPPNQIVCPLSTSRLEEGNVLSFAAIAFTITSNGVEVDRAVAERFVFSGLPSRGENSNVQLGEAAIQVEDKEYGLRTLVLDGLTHWVFKSTDSLNWAFESTAVTMNTTESPNPKYERFLRWGDKSVLLAINGLSQVTSKDLGSTWGAPELPFFLFPVRTAVAEFHTAVYVGLRGRPGIWSLAMGSGKGSERPVNIASQHNVQITKGKMELSKFDDKYISATKFECIDNASPTPAQGCQSSSVVEMIPLGKSKFLFLYDMLGASGFNVGNGGEDKIFGMVMNVDETKEKETYERNKARADYEKKVEEENQKRQREQRREKRRKEKAKREAWEARDLIYKQQADVYQEKDGESVMVRDVEDQWNDIEGDYL